MTHCSTCGSAHLLRCNITKKRECISFCWCPAETKDVKVRYGHCSVKKVSWTSRAGNCIIILLTHKSNIINTILSRWHHALTSWRFSCQDLHPIFLVLVTESHISHCLFKTLTAGEHNALSPLKSNQCKKLNLLM